jgi:hypothetical protein
MTFPAQAMQILVELQVGEGGTWVDVTEDLRMSSGVDISRGRQDEASEVNPGKCTLVLNNRHGKYSEFNPDGPYYGRLTKNTPIRVSVAPFGDGVYYPRFAGEVSKWPPRWDISDTDVWVPIEAAGILRRIRANTEFPISSHQRFIQSNSPYTYWPMTEGEDAIEASPIFGVSKMRSISDSGALFSRQPQWGKGEIAPWMENVVAFPQEHHMVASFPVTPDETAWSFEWVQTGFPPDDSSTFVIRSGDNESGRTIEITAQFVVGSDILFVSDTGTFVGSPFLEGDISKMRGPGPHLVRVEFIPTATSYIGNAYLNGELIYTGVPETDVPLFAPTGMRYISSLVDPDFPEPDSTLYVGHVVVYGPDAPDPMDSYRALVGYKGELAGRRIERLCSERGVPLEVVGDLDQTQACGHQQVETFAELLQSAADVDGGTLGESTEDLALLYRTQRSKYNQGSVL